MIDEKKLIEELESLPLIHGRYDHENANSDFISGIETWYEAVLKKINEQPKCLEWIPCSERLPEEAEKEGINGIYKLYLVILDDATEGIGAYMHYEKAWLTKKLYGQKHFSTDNTVIAWMELPEPYKVGD